MRSWPFVDGPPSTYEIVQYVLWYTAQTRGFSYTSFSKFAENAVTRMPLLLPCHSHHHWVVVCREHSLLCRWQCHNHYAAVIFYVHITTLLLRPLLSMKHCHHCDSSMSQSLNHIAITITGDVTVERAEWAVIIECGNIGNAENLEAVIYDRMWYHCRFPVNPVSLHKVTAVAIHWVYYRQRLYVIAFKSDQSFSIIISPDLYCRCRCSRHYPPIGECYGHIGQA